MLFTFPSQYWFTIGLWGVFSLSGWSRIIHAEFLVLRATQDTATTRIITPYGTFTLYGPAFQPSSGSDTSQISQSYNPVHALPHVRFGLFPVRSPLLGESFDYFLFL